MFKEEGNILIAVYSRIIGIPISQIEAIVSKNKIAELFLTQEPALKVTSDLENLEILVRATLLRAYGDLSKINSRDIEFIYKNYDITIQLEPNTEKNEYKSSEIIRAFEDERKTDHRLSNLIQEIELI